MRNNKNVFLNYFFILIISGIILFAAFMCLKKDKIELKLIGDKTIDILLNEDYKDKGAVFKVNNKEKKIKFTENNDIDNIKVGTYKYSYKVNYNDKEYKVDRTINVIDNESPKIYLDNEDIILTNVKKKEYSNLSYYAIDNYDGDITNKVIVKYGKNDVTLEVADSSNNFYTASYSVKRDNEINHIELNGKKNVYIKKGSKYKELGAIIKDSKDKGIKEEVEIEGKVNTNKVGIYYIIYSYENYKIRRRVEVYEPVVLDKIPSEGEKIVFLSFDDGPGKYTEELLEILDKYNVKATFFVTNQFSKYVPLIEEEAKRGHAVGVHTYTHNWDIYDSLESYLSDFNKMNEVVKKYTGSYTNIFRFPGGSSNTVSKGHATGVVSRIASYMLENGYTYYDWNVDSTDAAGGSSEAIKNNVINGIKKTNVSYVLMHDIKQNTINVIEEIVKFGVENGYQFKTIDQSSPTKHHSINN